MPKPIGFHATSSLIVIDDNGVFPPRSLTACPSPNWQDRIQIDDLAGKGVQNVLWGDVTSLDGSYTPASMADALAYLQGEFAKSASAGDVYAVPVEITASGQTTISLQQPPSRLATFRVEVNGVVYRPPDIGVSETAVTWANPSFSLEPSDRVTLVYS